MSGALWHFKFATSRVGIHATMKDLTRKCGVLNVNFRHCLIDKDSLVRGLKVYCSEYKGGICSLQGGRKM